MPDMLLNELRRSLGALGLSEDVMGWRSGAPGGSRTHDPRFRRPTLCPLSYGRAPVYRLVPALTIISFRRRLLTLCKRDQSRTGELGTLCGQEFCLSIGPRDGLNKSVDCNSTHRKLSRADGLFRVSLVMFSFAGGARHLRKGFENALHKRPVGRFDPCLPFEQVVAEHR